MGDREFSLWSFLRSVMSQGADIHLDHQGKGYELYSARLDEAAREREEELARRLQPARVPDTQWLREFRADVLTIKDDPHKGDMVFRCGINGAVDVVVSRIDAMLAAAPAAERGQDAGEAVSETYFQEAVAEALGRWPESSSAILFMASAVGPTLPITAEDIAWANEQLAATPAAGRGLDVPVWHEEITGMVQGPALYEGQQEWVRREDVFATPAPESREAAVVNQQMTTEGREGVDELIERMATEAVALIRIKGRAPESSDVRALMDGAAMLRRLASAQQAGSSEKDRNPHQVWPEFDRVVIDAWKDGGDGLDLDLIACRKAMLGQRTGSRGEG